ncbi:MAG: citrate synthase [Candidatus Krumholzibacteria bacterium]|nr:citrate synthase [Candidatus Krumholzibacteria bacterium]
MIEYIPGLERVPAAESSLSFIDGEKGILEYRGIRIEDLAENCTFDEVCFLLLEGRLPTASGLDEFTRREREARQLDPYMVDLIRCLPKDAHPMAKLQTCVSAMGMWMGPLGMYNDETRMEWAIRFIGRFPSIIPAIHRTSVGRDIVEPDVTLGRSSDFLRMLTGEAPDPRIANTLNVALILHAEHAMNASTFATRVVASTESEPGAAIAAAVGSLAGPLHGGANERVIGMLEEIGSVEAVQPWFEKKMANQERIMGMGHRVYSTKDPRATILQGLCHKIPEVKSGTRLCDIAMELERLAVPELGRNGIYPNVDFYSGILYHQIGIPTDLFTSVFALARIAGWMAHWMEQMRRNRIFRPTQIYKGPRDVPFTPMDRRG